MNLSELIAYIDSSGIKVDYVNDKLSIKEPRPNSGTLTPEFRESIKALKPDLIARLWPSDPEPIPNNAPEAIQNAPEPTPKPCPDPGPFPHKPFYWREALPWWPDHLRLQYAKFTDYWLDVGYSLVWAEWRAWKGMVKVINDHEVAHPNDPIKFVYPSEESPIDNIPEWDSPVTFSEQLASGIEYARSISVSIDKTPRESKPKTAKPKKSTSKRNQA